MSEPIIHRLLVPVQARGNIGKSTVLNVIAGWLEQRSIEWHGFDLDPDHRCFERTFPDTVSPVTLGDEPEGDSIKLLRSCASRPVTVIDPRAHLNEILLRSFELVRFQEWFSAAGGKLTVLLFPADDLEIMTDIDRTVSRLAASVDYIVVRNRARAPRTRMFDGSELESDLVKLGAVILRRPPQFDVLLGGIIAGTIFGAVIGAAAVRMEFGPKLRRAAEAQEFLDYAHSAGVNLRIEPKANGNHLTISGPAAARDARWSRDAKGNIVGAELEFPEPVPLASKARR